MAAVTLRWEWVLNAGPKALWPWVSDTDFINQAAGLAPVHYAWEHLPHGGRRRIASSRLGPMATSWVENPFDWVEGEAFGVQRDFLGGPLKQYRSRVSLTPLPDGQCQLVHSLELSPRLGVPATFVRWAVGGMQAGFERAYRAAEAAARAESADESLGPPHPASLAALTAQAVPLNLAQRLAAHMVHAPARQAEQMRPFALADAWGMSRQDLLGACFAGVRGGVLEARWALRCPHCLGSKGVAAKLADLKPEAACEDCQATFGATLDQNAELSFRPSPAVRLPQAQLYCVAGPAATRHLVSQGFLVPGERKLLDLSVLGGAYRLRRGTTAVVELSYDPEGEAGVGGPFDVAASEVSEAHLGGPTLSLAIANHGPDVVPYALAALSGGEAHCPVAVALSHPEFSRTFPGEQLAPHLSFELMSLSVLAWRGPAPVETEAHRFGGFLALGLGGQPLWVFYDPLDALKAAFAQASPGRAWALEVGPGVLTGVEDDLPVMTGGAPEAAVSELASAPLGSLTLSPWLAEDASLRFQLLMAGWVVLGDSALGGLVMGPEGLPMPSEARP